MIKVLRPILFFAKDEITTFERLNKYFTELAIEKFFKDEYIKLI